MLQFVWTAYMDGWEVECVLPGCVWSRPKPEELKALNVIIRAVGEPSSNHTQITYTLTPTHNTSHSRLVCELWWSERKNKKKRQEVHVHAARMHSMLVWKSMCTDNLCGHSAGTGREERLRCVEKRVYFSLLFLPPSLSLISHPSIFHFYMQLQMWREWNIKLPKWAFFCTLTTSKTSQPTLFADLTHTIKHIHSFW